MKKPEWFKVGQMVYIGKVMGGDDIPLKIIGIIDAIASLEGVGDCPIIGLTEAILTEDGKYKRGQSYWEYDNEKNS